MSSTTKKKHVTKEVLEEYPLPEGSRQVVKVTASRGNHLHEVQTAGGELFLASMPSKFRRHVWIKRGDFILVEPIEEGEKVKAEISHILFREQIKNIQEKGLWPESFRDKPAHQKEMIPEDHLPPSDDEDSGEYLGDLVVNLNRVNIAQVSVGSDDDSEDDASSDEDSEDDASDDDPASDLEKEKSANDVAADVSSLDPVKEGCPAIT